MLIIDKYSYTNKIKNWNPLLKCIIFSAGILFSHAGKNYFLNAAVIFVMLFLTICIAKIRFVNFIKLFRIPFFFIVISLLGIIITVNAKQNIAEIKIGNTVLGISHSSIMQSVRLFFTVVSSICSLYFLILTTPIIQFIKLFKKLKMPPAIIELMILIYRSIFIFLEEYAAMKNAQVLKFGTKNKKLLIKSMAVIAANLFSGVLRKHEEMTLALELKLYDGTFRIGD